jgi:phosphoglycolate phosphatase
MIRPILIFDLDGTLTDPRLGITRSIRFALERLSVTCPNDDVLASFIGPPLRGTFSTLLQTADTVRIEEAMTLYRQRFSTEGLYENEVYPGIPSMLELVSAAATLYIATSKPTIYAQHIVELFDLNRYFDKVYGAELSGCFENKKDLLEYLLMTEDLKRTQTIMIGDRAVDIAAAKENGIRSIGVTWGYGSTEELLGADILCMRPSELQMILSQLDI